MNTIQSLALRLAEKALLPGPNERMGDQEASVLATHLASVSARPYSELLAMRGMRHGTVVKGASGTSFVVTVYVSEHRRAKDTLHLYASVRRGWSLGPFQWAEEMLVDRDGPIADQCSIPQVD